MKKSEVVRLDSKVYCAIGGIAIVFATLGLMYLSQSRAATPAAVAEAESGVKAGNAGAGDASGASGGASVKFGVNNNPDPGIVTAAARFNWGVPLPVSDEFNYGSESAPVPVNSSKWGGGGDTCGPGHAGNGRRCGKNSRVHGDRLVMTGQSNGDTGWLRQNHDQQYGRWETRSRSRNTGPTGATYHVLHLLWPQSERWPQDGEYDWVEYFDPDAKCLVVFIHYPHPNLPVQQEYREKCPVDMTQWHTFAIEWTPNHIKGFVDGVEWYSMSGGAGPGGRRNIQTMPSGHLNIQLDNFTGAGGLRPAVFEVDWSRVYRL